MCGRFVQAAEPSTYAEMFGARLMSETPPPASYNVAPTDAVLAVAEHGDERLLGTFRWGLIPFWAKDRRIAARNINARSETVHEKAAFRDSFTGRRCLIPADGFYEWQRMPRGKLPHYIHRTDGSPMAFAGLWASWRDREHDDERVRTCTIITGAPNDTVAPIHDRMPVMLPSGDWDAWLDPGNDDVEQLRSLLRPVAADTVSEHPVSTLVNKVANNVPECIAPLTTPATEQLEL